MLRSLFSHIFNASAALVCAAAFLSASGASADDFEFSRMDNSFKNFIRCELTRTSAPNPFKGKPFEITMIDLFDIQEESDLKIITGAVQCFVENRHRILYAAVGLKKVLGKQQVVCLTIRHKDFSILATELLRYPYKERCQWSEYWIDLD